MDDGKDTARGNIGGEMADARKQDGELGHAACFDSRRGAQHSSAKYAATCKRRGDDDY